MPSIRIAASRFDLFLGYSLLVEQESNVQKKARP